MEDEAAVGCAAAAPLTGDTALDSLRWHWGDAYEIGHDAKWWFRRRDGYGGAETASSPDARHTAIIENYTARPVDRDRAADVECRRAKYEAEGVRIWHDPGGWHARWAAGGTEMKTGVSHPDDLAGLLDRLDALRRNRM
jgi:hypothetical protein